MKLVSMVCVVAAIGFASTARAQQPLTPTQAEGQRLFVQHCGLCHLKIQINVAAPNGPVLTKAVVEGGRAAQARAQIADGSPNMPGYKHMFDRARIDALVDYIRTLAPAATPANR